MLLNEREWIKQELDCKLKRKKTTSKTYRLIKLTRHPSELHAASDPPQQRNDLQPSHREGQFVWASTAAAAWIYCTVPPER